MWEGIAYGGSGKAAHAGDGKRQRARGHGLWLHERRGVRAGVQHLHGGLSGNRDRPQLHRADGGDDLSPHRQLRHHRRGQRNPRAHHGRAGGARILRHAQQLPLYQNAGRDFGRKRHSRPAGRGHAAHRPDDPQRGQPARADLRRGYPCRGGAGARARLSAAHRLRQPRELQEEVVRPHPQPALQRGGGGLRHQAQHRAKAQPVRLQRDRGALRHPCRHHSQLQARRAVPLQRPRRSRGCAPGDRSGTRAARAAAHLRHLPGASDDCVGVRGAHL